MCDSEVVDLTLEDEPKPSAGSPPQFDLAALAREREARRQSRGDDGGDAKRARIASTPAAPTGEKSTRPFRYSLQIREQRQRRGCIAQKLAPEAKREAPGPSLRDRLRGLVAGPFEGEGRAVAGGAAGER